MKIKGRMLAGILAVGLLLSGCTVYAAENTEETEAAAAAAGTVETAAAETEPAAQPSSGKLHYQPSLSETVMPGDDSATGTLCFYLNGQAIHAGSPVSDLIGVGFHTYGDLTATVQPWEMSTAIRALVDLPEVEEKDEPYIFFVAMNASDEPCTVAECLIYSITVNCEKGISFGSGNESEPFVSGVSTRDEIMAAYGEPDETVSNNDLYEEIFYYEPFNCVSFAFRGGVVRQISAYYSANVYGGLDVDFALDASAMEKDAYILMSQYMDVTPYLEKEEAEAESETDGEEKDQDKTGILEKFNGYFELNNTRILFDTAVSELPDPFRENLVDLSMPVDRNYYVRTGRNEPEEFFLINSEGQRKQLSNYLRVKGVVTENYHYTNWGFDNSAFHSFNCQGVTENSTIDDVLEMLGQPRELICSSGERTCFAWMHYETEEGDTLRIRVDPMRNQVIEVHMSKYFENEQDY